MRSSVLPSGVAPEGCRSVVDRVTAVLLPLDVARSLLWNVSVPIKGGVRL